MKNVTLDVKKCDNLSLCQTTACKLSRFM